MTPKIAIDKPGSFVLLNGDEAVARGTVEAGVKLAASYPGTPSTEILEAIAEVAKDFGIHAEWSVNEIVAAEVAAGASMAGVRSIVSMKHVGLNVAADAAMTLAYTGVDGGMVIAVCDDPAMHSSQNEQDTRYFSVHSNLPLLDAGNPQEALDMTREAFELSEKLQLPVIVRLTTRVAHGKARVRLRELQRITRKAEFDKDGARWVMVPSNAIRQHRVLQRKLAEAKKLVDNSKFNIIEDNGKEVGIIGSGIGYYYARSILDATKFSWLKLGFVYPFPTDLVKKFASKVKKIIVIEELRPYIEENMQRLKVKDGYAKLSLEITKNHTNSLGAAHGGAIFALADCAFAEASNFGENVAVAVQVSINFLKPAIEGDTLTAEAVRVSEGKTLGLYHVTISNQNKKIAFFSGLAFKT